MAGRHGTPRRPSRAWLVTTFALVAIGVMLLVRAVDTKPQLPPAAAQQVPSSVSTSAPELMAVPKTAHPLPASVPVSIRIPSISVDAPVTSLGLAADGTIALPPLSDHNLAGWYEGSASPGHNGTSVILGHVDDYAGTSVFFYIKELRAGDKVEVSREDGRTAVFTVDGVQKVAKASYPASDIYHNEPYPALRLITCGGPFDATTGQYADNIVVYAHLTA